MRPTARAFKPVPTSSSLLRHQSPDNDIIHDEGGDGGGGRFLSLSVAVLKCFCGRRQQRLVSALTMMSSLLFDQISENIFPCSA